MRAVIREKLQKAATPAHAEAINVLTRDAVLFDACNGSVFTFGQIAKRLQISHELVRRTFRGEPGVLRIGSTYRVPVSVYERVITRSLVALRLLS